MSLSQDFDDLENRIASATNDAQSLKSVMDFFFGVVCKDPGFPGSNGLVVDQQINRELTAYGRQKGYLGSNDEVADFSQQTPGPPPARFTYCPNDHFLFGKFMMGDNTGFFLYSQTVPRKGAISVIDDNCQGGVCYSLFPVPEIVAAATAQSHARLIRAFKVGRRRGGR